MNRLVLDELDTISIQKLLEKITQKYASVADEDFLVESCVLAHELPKQVHAFLNDFRHSEPSWGIAVISGYPINDERIGNTPEHWRESVNKSASLPEDILLVLLGTLLGDVFGWAAEQGGHIVHDVIPIKEHENKQMSTGSNQTIWWHTEEAFHPYTSDYVGLMCLRNPDRVPTTYACIDSVDLNQEVVKILFEKQFIISPVESHLDRYGSDIGTNGNGEYAPYYQLKQKQYVPEKISVMYGDPRSPYIRIDPYYMDMAGPDSEAKRALSELVRIIEESLSEVVLAPGDFCFINNYKTVHGRKPFKAKYDGKDRWLKRINLTRDLRKSRAVRASEVSRIIH
jgi:Fe(II)/alpha-ketoglutarate-dependent arginine beta-hydroxylase